MNRGTPPPIPAGRIVHIEPACLGLERIAADEADGEPVAERCGARRFDDGARDSGIRYGLAMADEAAVGHDTHKQHLLRPVSPLLDLPQAEVKRLDRRDPHRAHAATW